MDLRCAFDQELIPAFPQTIIGSVLGIIATVLLMIHCRRNRCGYSMLAVIAIPLIFIGYFVGGFGVYLLTSMIELLSRDIYGSYGSTGAYLLITVVNIAIVICYVKENFPDKYTRPWTDEWQSTPYLWGFVSIWACLFVSFGAGLLGMLLGAASEHIMIFLMKSATSMYLILGAFILAGIMMLVPSIPVMEKEKSQ